ncbi:MAG: superoxide dismutase, Fe-Mn family [Parcubacteria group bacterium Licking1014_1]|nr:MAG: superoxide dismutase, Fe-Mn family [Parcubacteria group bacterium Licking1014_1]
MGKKYELPNLSYGYKDLEPYISEEVLTLHHAKHHQGYVNAANALLEKIWEARKNNAELDYKSVLKSLSFNTAGHILHETFWKIMAPADSGKNKPEGQILKAIEDEFGSLERFKTEFSETAISVEGSGWAVLTHHKDHGNLSIIQIEKHNLNFYPEQKILLALDVWEHAYYLDYKNDRAKFIEAFWNIVNWEEIEKRFLGN